MIYRIIDDETGAVLHENADRDALPTLEGRQVLQCLAEAQDQPTPVEISADAAISRGAFMERLGAQREILLHSVRLNPAADLIVRAQLETLMAMLNRRGGVVFAHKETQLALAVISGVLISLGDLAVDEVDAFYAQMTAPATVDELA